MFSNDAGYYILKYLTAFIAVAFVLTLHEFAHSFVAYKCGDSTPKFHGRLSLNPLRHFDVLGLVMFVLVGFGWAKPVPINPYNFKNYKRGIILTSIAGIVINLITAFIFYPLITLSYNLELNAYASGANIGYVLALLLYLTVYKVYIYSISFAVFNLLPLPPLDGFNFLEALVGGGKAVIRFLRRYGNFILIALIAESYLCQLLSYRFAIAEMFDVLGYILSFAQNIVGFPIIKFWGLFKIF